MTVEILRLLIFFYVTYMIAIFYFFFFSSRRRHTRCSRDWSSDVCSSDLPECIHLVAEGGKAEINAPLIEPLIAFDVFRPAVDAGTKDEVPLVAAPHREIGRASCRERV